MTEETAGAKKPRISKRQATITLTTKGAPTATMRRHIRESLKGAR